MINVRTAPMTHSELDRVSTLVSWLDRMMLRLTAMVLVVRNLWPSYRITHLLPIFDLGYIREMLKYCSGTHMQFPITSIPRHGRQDCP